MATDRGPQRQSSRIAAKQPKELNENQCKEPVPVYFSEQEMKEAHPGILLKHDI
jgi:hypothetical protein